MYRAEQRASADRVSQDHAARWSLSLLPSRAGSLGPVRAPPRLSPGFGARATSVNRPLAAGFDSGGAVG